MYAAYGNNYPVRPKLPVCTLNCLYRKKVPVSILIAVILFFTLNMVPQVYGQENRAPEVNLQLAIVTGNYDAVKQHIKAGSDLNEKDQFGSTPLNIAATFGRTEIAKALIDAGADPNALNSDGSSPLHTAAFFCRTEIVKALMENGGNRYLKNQYGSTAFDIVAVPFDVDKDIYDKLGAALAPLGLKLDYERLRKTRPVIAEMLRPRPEELAKVNYKPLSGNNWKVSTPEEQGLNPMLVKELYFDADHLETIYGLLVIKNGCLVAEKYFNGGSVDQKVRLASVTKSYTSALVGIAIDQGYLSSVDQKMIDFFPELAGQVTDKRKEQITIGDMLKMRAGYPWEEMTEEHFKILYTGFRPGLLINFPLTMDPGSGFQYSNLTSHLLGIIVSRACGTDLKTFGRENLFLPINAEIGEWTLDLEGNCNGHGDIHFTARDAAKLGLVYLNDGKYEGKQVVPSGWVRESLQNYSRDAWISKDKLNYAGRYFHDLGYGYQWWSASVGDYRFNFAWGHGGQLIVLLDEYDMVIVVTSFPFWRQHDDESWKHERANINLVGKFIKSLTSE
jgi:CubicO group peptidase (beta-lactamase class C family)